MFQAIILLVHNNTLQLPHIQSGSHIFFLVREQKFCMGSLLWRGIVTMVCIVSFEVVDTMRFLKQ